MILWRFCQREAIFQFYFVKWIEEAVVFAEAIQTVVCVRLLCNMRKCN